MQGRRDVWQNCQDRDVCVIGGLLLRTIGHKRGSLEVNGYNSTSGKTSVGMCKLKELMEKTCSDLLAIHHRKCTHGRMDHGTNLTRV
jgi:hypothetical protein